MRRRARKAGAHKVGKMDRFVVGTGRCGSTLLSRMLATNPQVLSVFEFFNGLDMGVRFSADPTDGKDFAALISREQPFVTAVLRRGYEVAEITYPFGGRARYERDDPLPWILVAVLPRLSEDPDSLFDEVVTFAAGLPRQHLAVHYRRLFDWLTERMGRAVWIERSGSSIEYLGCLHEFFPRARFLHLHRDGPESALSMREHHAYRLPISLLYQAPTDDGVPASELGAIDLDAAPDPQDAISRILASRPPAEYFGRYWTDQIVRGFRALGRLNADQYLEVRFEDLVSRPRDVLRMIGQFFELDADRGGWIERAAALVHGVPPTRFELLCRDERQRLDDACRVGRQLLGRIP